MILFSSNDTLLMILNYESSGFIHHLLLFERAVPPPPRKAKPIFRLADIRRLSNEYSPDMQWMRDYLLIGCISSEYSWISAVYPADYSLIWRISSKYPTNIHRIQRKSTGYSGERNAGFVAAGSPPWTRDNKSLCSMNESLYIRF